MQFQIKTEKFTWPNKGLLVLGQRTDAHREDCFVQEHPKTTGTHASFN